MIACPAQRQSGEAVRRVREILLKIGVELKSDHVYGLELKNGSRVLALPGSEDSIRGLTVDGLIVADEAARLSEAIFASLWPMRAAPSAWADDDPSWAIPIHFIRLRSSAATVRTGNTYSEFADVEELPQGLFGSARASALETIYRRNHSNGLIVTDLSFDPTYAEVLFERFGSGVIGLQISRHGCGRHHGQ